LRLLALDDLAGEKTWHVAGYNEFFPDIESAEAALAKPEALTKSSHHIALTNRAFESTQVARLSNVPLLNEDLDALRAWRMDPSHEVSDRSVRLMLGLR
jgi:hypothetical protein